MPSTQKRLIDFVTIIATSRNEDICGDFDVSTCRSQLCRDCLLSEDNRTELREIVEKLPQLIQNKHLDE